MVEGQLNPETKQRLEQTYQRDCHDTVHGFLEVVCTYEATDEQTPNIPEGFTPAMVAKTVGYLSDEAIGDIRQVLDTETSNRHHREMARGYLGKLAMENGDH